MNRKRIIKERATLLTREPFTGHDRLDQPTLMYRYSFYVPPLGYYFRWNTQKRLDGPFPKEVLLSATPLADSPRVWGGYTILPVTRCKVYHAPPES